MDLRQEDRIDLRKRQEIKDKEELKKAKRKLFGNNPPPRPSKPDSRKHDYVGEDLSEPPLRRSKRAPAPRTLKDNLYGEKSVSEIELEISKQKDELQKLIQEFKQFKSKPNKTVQDK